MASLWVRRAALRRHLPFFWSVWNFSKNKQAAKSLLAHLSQPTSIEKLVEASGGYDLPAFEKLTTLKVWAEAGAAEGHALPLSESLSISMKLSIAASPAPPKIAQQIYTQATLTKMCLRYAQGEGWKRRSPGRKANAKASCERKAKAVAATALACSRRLPPEPTDRKPAAALGE